MKIAICGYRSKSYSVGQPDGTISMIQILSSGLHKIGHEIYNLNIDFDKSFKNLVNRYCVDGIINIDFQGNSALEIAKSIVGFFDSHKIDVMIPMNSPLLTSVIPYLPQSTNIVTWCNSINDHAYFCASAHIDYLSRIIVISPRQEKDLELKWKINKSKIKLIPLGTEPIQTLPEKDFTNLLKICYVGRFEEPQKGVHILPKIYEQLIESGLKFHFELIGDGPERQFLKKRLENLNHVDISEKGISREELYVKLLDKHILITPSKFEGFGMVVIEAMMNKVVPIVSSVNGVLDWIVQDGVTGFVRDRKNPRLFSDVIIQLGKDRNLLETLANNARERALTNFNSIEMINAWDSALSCIYASNEKPQPKDFSKYREFRGWRPSLTRRAKNFIGLEPRY